MNYSRRRERRTPHRALRRPATSRRANFVTPWVATRGARGRSKRASRCSTRASTSPESSRERGISSRSMTSPRTTSSCEASKPVRCFASRVSGVRGVDYLMTTSNRSTDAVDQSSGVRFGARSCRCGTPRDLTLGVAGLRRPVGVLGVEQHLDDARRLVDRAHCTRVRRTEPASFGS